MNTLVLLAMIGSCALSTVFPASTSDVMEVKHLDSLFRAKKGIVAANKLVDRFHSIVASMMKDQPECAHLLIQSPVASDFIFNHTRTSEIIDAYEKKRLEGNLEDEALARLFVEAANDIRALVKDL